jgi:hypothetical protein
MKKFYLSLLILGTYGLTAKAQLSNGGLPLSMQSPLKNASYVPKQSYIAPDWTTFIAKSEKDESIGLSRPYQVALPVSTELSFPSSGSIITQADNSKIWRAQIQIQGAPAIGLYYDNFKLPEGVKMFLSNDNENQVLGSFTSANNSDDNLFANEPVLGEIVNIELNIEPGVDLNAIQLHMNKALVYFRSYEYLNKYQQSEDANQSKPTDVDPLGIEGSSSTCQINAICPLGVNYPKQRKSTVQIIHPDGFFCSASLVNNTGNTASSCKNYLLTATHCEPNNDTSGAPFSQLLVRFNFERKSCGLGAAAQVNTLTGVNFRARANYIDASPPEINGDFLLVELKSAIPVSWDVYQTGWNRATTMPANLVYPKRYIGFHHPAGDVKKVTTYNALGTNGEAGGSLGPGTHWMISDIDSGGIEGGSSGSGLFDGNGRLIGIASVAGNPDPNCATSGKGDHSDFYRFVEYGKFSLAWDYTEDGDFGNRMLKPWLDPTNSGVMTLDPLKSNCSDFGSTGITNNNALLDNNISIYPNPTSTGIVTARINFATASDVDIEIFNITGAKQGSYHLKNILNGAYTFDLSAYANGMYLIRFSNGDNFTTKKIMLAK